MAMKTLCQTEGHTFTVTLKDNIKSRTCVYCPHIRTPFSKEAPKPERTKTQLDTITDVEGL